MSDTISMLLTFRVIRNKHENRDLCKGRPTFCAIRGQ